MWNDTLEDQFNAVFAGVGSDKECNGQINYNQRLPEVIHLPADDDELWNYGSCERPEATQRNFAVT
jgi:hypothetical protein